MTERDPFFGYTEEQRLIRRSVLDLLERALPAEKIRALDTAGEFPFEAYDALAAAGWMGLPFATEYGGTGGTHKDLAVLIEAMSSHYASMATAYLTTVVYAGMHVYLHAPPELKAEIIPKVARGELKMAFALTEPEAGSDAAAIRTRAQKDGQDYVLHGSKLYITCAHVADYLVVVAKTTPEAAHRGMSIFLVPARAAEVRIQPLDTLGRRTTRACEVFFDGLRVPRTMMLGEENGGWPNLMRCLNLERMCIAACSAGNMQHVIEYARSYARERHQFRQPITRFQAIAHKFADMQIMAETTRLLVYRVAEMLDAGKDPLMETAIAKVVATENDFRCADLGMQIMGGAGYMMTHDMQRFFRDTRVGPIGAGTSEIQRNVIAKLMGLG
jgi:alkylation response protein AidB-like acyl-CoA dehydrogenase